MRLPLARLEGDVVHIDLSQAGPEVRAVARDAMEGELTQLQGKLHIEAHEGRVVVHGELQVGARRACERCGQPLELRVGGDVELVYLPEEPSLLGGEREIEAEDLDVGWYSGEALVLEDVVSEAVALLLPHLVACVDSKECSMRTQELLARYGRSGDEGALSGLGALMNKG